MDQQTPTPAEQPLAGTSRNPDKVALAGLILQILLAALAFMVYMYTGRKEQGVIDGSGSVLGEVFHLVPGVVIWLLCYLRLRLGRLADEEEKELESLRQRTEGAASLFESSQKPDAYTAKGRLDRLERVFVPSMTVLSSLAMILVGVCILGGWFYLASNLAADRLAIAGAFLLAFAFVGFAFSQYAIGLSSIPEFRHLRPAGAYLLSNSFCLALCAVGLWLLRAEINIVETFLTIGLPVLVVLLGIEYVVNFILDFFRPRIPGQELRPAYDSRLFGIFAQPGSLWNAVADTLDYQFGFRVSKTWFYHFLSRLIVPLAALQLLSALALTCIVVVDYDEVVLVERFGKPRQDVLRPGLHIKLPWPIEHSYAIPADRIHRIQVGIEHSKENEHDEDAHEQSQGHSHGAKKKRKMPKNVDVWTDTSHTHADFILLASRETLAETSSSGIIKRPLPEPVKDRQPGKLGIGLVDSVSMNVLSVSLAVHYKISSDRDGLFDYFYHQTEPERYLQSITYRELVQLASTVDLHDLMGPKRIALTSQLRSRVQEKAMTARLGMKIVYVGFLEMHPPSPIARVFESVVEAQERSRGKVIDAESFSARLVPMAETQGKVLEDEAESYRFQREYTSNAEAAGFLDRVNAYRQGSERIYRSRYYLSTLEEVLKGKRKLIIPADMTEELFVLKLEDKLKADLLDIDFNQ